MSIINAQRYFVFLLWLRLLSMWLLTFFSHRDWHMLQDPGAILWHAAGKGFTEIVTILVNARANVNVQDTVSASPLHTSAPCFF